MYTKNEQLKIKDMNQGVFYKTTQYGHGYSDGVLVKREGDEIIIRHFWENPGKDYYADIVGVYFPTDKNKDQIVFIHKDVIKIVENSELYNFEEMTLSEFYDIVYLDVYDKYMDLSYTIPTALQDKIRVTDAKGTLL